MQMITSSSLTQGAKNKINENFAELDARATQALTAGSGFAGTGTVYKSGVRSTGGIIKTEIMIDLTGASSVATDLDIIGTHATNPAHIGQLTAAMTGATILMGKMTCLEVPVGGAIDIDLYSATVGTGALSLDVTTLVETALVTSAADWTLARELAFGAVPTATGYLYLVSGAATAGAYSAGKFLIEIWGY